MTTNVGEDHRVVFQYVDAAIGQGTNGLNTGFFPTAMVMK